MGLLLAIFGLQSHGADWSLCGVGLQIPERPTPETQGGAAGSTHVSADEADLVDTGTSVLQGNVQVIQDGRQIQADKVNVTRPEQVLDAFGNVQFWDDGLYVTGDTAHVDMETEFATVDGAKFVFLDAHGSGGAEKITLTSRNLARVEGATYTTCDPGQEDWVLVADDIELDRVTEWGTARNVTVKFKGMPIFYSPWMNFPLTDKRKTGFLTPSYRLSGETGFEFHLPYYWNIAPERDATLTARGMTKRGILLAGEYRYLSDLGYGQLGVEYLPNDSERGEDRAAVSFQHDTALASGWETDIDVDWVSDDDYFEELGTDLTIASTRFLERRGDLIYRARRWSALARVQDYQTVDQTLLVADRPYKRLPQLQFNAATPNRNRQLNADVQAEFVNFDRSSGVIGTRATLNPTVSYPLRGTAGFVIPKAGVEFTTYSLDGQAASADDTPARILPTFSLDSGLLFERDLQLGDGQYVQTLEPRAFYLFVPHEGQDDIPVFDTGEYTFSFAQLFREDRFSGSDRIGDANQVALALTSRLLSQGSGEELLRASIGQIYFFRDRDVQLSPGDGVETDGTSDLVAELSAQIYDDWRLTTGFQWNVDDRQTNRNTLRLRYQPDTERVLNLEYRFVRDAVEQTDLSFRWPIKNNWGVVGRWNYALPESRTLEAVGGIEYNSCCWSARAVARRFQTNTDGEFDNAIFLQLELKGLAGVGRSTADFLRRTIPGYRNTF